MEPPDSKREGGGACLVMQLADYDFLEFGILFVFQICCYTSMAPPILKPKVNISLLKEDYFKEVWEDFSELQVCK